MSLLTLRLHTLALIMRQRLGLNLKLNSLRQSKKERRELPN